MGLYEELTTDDKEFFIEQVSNNADFTEEGYYCEPTAPLSYILRFWEQSKTKFYNAFGQTLILEKDFVYTCNQAEIQENMWQEMECDSFIFDYRRWLRNNIVKPHTPHLDGYTTMMRMVDYDVLAENASINSEVLFAETKESEIIRIDAKCKVIRFLNKINKKYIHSPHFETFRIKHSMVLNTTKAKGTLCLSIHPNDFITMSDNAYNWDSCMSWENQGEYKAGTIEMMNSPCVIIAYLQGDKHNSRWFNKKWRELFIVTPEIITGIKGYPYHNETFETICMNWLRELVTNNENFEEYFDKTFTIASNCAVTEIETNPTFYIYPNGWMYNDYYEKHSALISKNIQHGIHYIEYSGVNNCLICGEANCFNMGSQIVCANCLDIHYCECCENWVHGEFYTDTEGTRYCQYCFESNTTTCELCEKPYPHRNLKEVRGMYKNKVVDFWWASHFCEDCIHSERFLNIFGEHTLHENIVYVQIENFSPEGFDYFGLDPENYPIEK